MFGTHLGTETSPTPVTLEFPSSQASCCRADRAEGIRQADGGIKEPGQNQRCKTFVWDCPVWVLPGSDSPSAPNPPRQALPPSCGSPQPTQPFEEATRCLEAPEEHRSPPKKPCSNPSPALHPAPGWDAGAGASPGGARALAWVLEQTELCVMVPCIRHILLLLLSPRCRTGAAHPGWLLPGPPAASGGAVGRRRGGGGAAQPAHMLPDGEH